MAHGRKLLCALCQRSEETKITGNLLTKDEITAHQYCLLYSSNIFCRESPQYDDLFGFSVEDVLDEVKRGSRLMCTLCKKKGATVGCEVKRCKKSYHYPCAVEDKATSFQDEETYGLYCLKHYQKLQEEQNRSITGHASSPSTMPQTSRSSSVAGPSKVNCLACERKEGSISLESLSNGINMFYCDKHAPSSRKRNTNGHAAGAGPSVDSGDSNSSSSPTQSSSKRQRSPGDRQDETPSKRKSVRHGVIIDDSSDSDNNEIEPNTEMEMFAPLESDLEESAPEQQAVPQSNSKDTEIPAGSPSGNQREDENEDENKDGDATIIHSDAESESLLFPVKVIAEPPPPSKTTGELSTQTEAPINPNLITVKAEIEFGSMHEELDPEQSAVHSPGPHATEPHVPQQGSSGPPPSPSLLSPRRVTFSPSCRSSPTAHLTNPVLRDDIDSASFWRSCNAAGCTQAIFADFINVMSGVSSRIQSDQASQDDYDLALSVMAVSGNLVEFVTKQQKELQRKQKEVEKAAAAMNEVVSALRK